jgi:hypothetical protein
MPENDSTADEEEEVAEPVFPDRGPGREGMVADYLPEEEDWAAKTQLDINDPAAISALRSMEVMFPEISDLQPVIDQFLDDFMKTKTSVDGRSREEYRKIFMAMYGKGEEEDSSRALQLVAADED